MHIDLIRRASYIFKDLKYFLGAVLCACYYSKICCEANERILRTALFSSIYGRIDQNVYLVKYMLHYIVVSPQKLSEKRILIQNVSNLSWQKELQNDYKL